MKTTRNILILCDAFGPPAFVPRVTSLARELQKHDWQVQVMSELMPGCEYNTKDFPLQLMTYYADNKVAYAYQWIADKLWQAKERTFTRFVEKHTDMHAYDAILCSTFNLFPLLTATHLSRKYGKPLLVDLRDIAEQADASDYFQHHLPRFFGFDQWLNNQYIQRNIRLRNQVLRQAAAVTTVSPWHVAQLQKLQPNTHLIYNGFDATEFTPAQRPSATFTVAYTGKLYEFQMPGLHLFAEALRYFLAHKEVNERDVSVDFYIAPIWKDKVLSICNIPALRTLDFVPRHELIGVLQQASVLLVLTDKTAEKGPHGMLTTKFFEALGVEKPVLCLRSDEDCLAGAIQQTNTGVAAKTAEEATVFLLEKYKEWQGQGFTHQNVQNKEVFTRQNQALQFDQLLRSIIK